MKQRHWVVDALIALICGGGLVAYLAFFSGSSSPGTGNDSLSKPVSVATAAPAPAPSATASAVASAPGLPPPAPEAQPSAERFSVEENGSVTTNDGVLRLHLLKIFSNERGVDLEFQADGHRSPMQGVLIGEQVPVRARGRVYHVKLHGLLSDGTADIEVFHATPPPDAPPYVAISELIPFQYRDRVTRDRQQSMSAKFDGKIARVAGYLISKHECDTCESSRAVNFTLAPTPKATEAFNMQMARSDADRLLATPIGSYLTFEASLVVPERRAAGGHDARIVDPTEK